MLAAQTSLHDPPTAAGIDGLSTHFNFAAKVFQLPGARFSLNQAQHEPRFFVTLGGIEASLDIKTLCAEFEIAQDCQDSRLIQIATRGLKYVPDIRPGDAIPSELLNGTASWTIQPKHRQIAERRLHVQLLSWVSGNEIVITDVEELGNFLGQIENKAKLRDAFEQAAQALGRSPGDHEFVLALIETLTRELSYIEALRDRFEQIAGLRDKLAKLMRQYETDSRLKQEIQRIVILHLKAQAAYGRLFEEVDAQTCEIIGALKSVDRQIQYIRKNRDELHFITREWNALLDRWANIEVKKSLPMDRLLTETYRLLAGKFAPIYSMLKK